MFGRNKIAKLVAELLGTGVLTLVVLSVQRSTIGVPFFVAIAAGLAAAVLIVAFGYTSVVQLNPAITIALWTARKVRTVEAVAYVAMQLLGAWLAYYLYTYFVNSSLQPIGGHFTGRILVAEAVGGVVLGLGWATVVYHNYTTNSKAALIGAAYMLAIIAASSASIGLINPALALGVRAWVWDTYVLGPVLGAVIGVNLYGLLFAPANTFARIRKVKAVSAKAVKPVAKKKATNSTKKK
jgi:glycerol uptake facilitator-like aquaporin